MKNMIQIQEAIIVEGTYDKIKLSQIVDATIITTGGFSIFKNKDKMELIKKLACKTGIVVLTDSDRAGFLIRNYIKQCVPSQYVKHAYIPEIKGVEKRKRIPGKEGLLGVEGIKNALIEEALRKAGCVINTEEQISAKDNSCMNGEKLTKAREITKVDFYNDGLTGKPNSTDLRRKLTQKLDLPSKISTNGLLQVLNTLCGYDKYVEIIKEIKQ